VIFIPWLRDRDETPAHFRSALGESGYGDRQLRYGAAGRKPIGRMT